MRFREAGKKVALTNGRIQVCAGKGSHGDNRADALIGILGLKAAGEFGQPIVMDKLINLCDECTQPCQVCSCLCAAGWYGLTKIDRAASIWPYNKIVIADRAKNPAATMKVREGTAITFNQLPCARAVELRSVIAVVL